MSADGRVDPVLVDVLVYGFVGAARRHRWSPEQVETWWIRVNGPGVMRARRFLRRALDADRGECPAQVLAVVEDVVVGPGTTAADVVLAVDGVGPVGRVREVLVDRLRVLPTGPGGGQ